MNKIETIKNELTDILNKIGVEFSLDVVEEEGCFKVQINTNNDASILIGKHGDMIHSMQKLLEAILYKKFQDDTTLLINVNDYREKQKERLEKIADNVAKRVIEEKRHAFLRSFSAYERKIIHEYISKNYSNLQSFSEGEGFDRKLVIKLTDEKE